MNRRRLGRTRLEVSEIGYGAWGIRQSMGMRSVRNVERNCAAGDGRGLPPEQVEKLHAHRWVRNFYR